MNDLLVAYLRYAVSEARQKHPVFAETPEQGICVIAEELLELIRAVNDGEPMERVQSEAMDVAVTALRMVEFCENEVKK